MEGADKPAVNPVPQAVPGRSGAPPAASKIASLLLASIAVMMVRKGMFHLIAAAG